MGDVGHTGGLTNPRRAPGVEDAEPVALIPVGLPCLERGCLVSKEGAFTQKREVYRDGQASLPLSGLVPRIV